MNTPNYIYMCGDYTDIYRICTKIQKSINKNVIPKYVIYNLSTEYTAPWFDVFFNKKQNQEFFILPYGMNELYKLLETYNIKFYLVVGCEYNDEFEFFYKNKSSNFEIIFWTTSLILLTYLGLKRFIHNNQITEKIEDLSIIKKFEKLYINYNNKARHHRCLLMDALSYNNLLNLGLNSWNELTNDGNGSPHKGFKFKYWKEEKLDIDGFQYYVNDEYRPNLLNMNCFVSVVTETSDKILFVTEKTYRQILIGQPFICLGAPNQNLILKKYGFELYDEIFDYEFDSKQKIEDRVKGIIDNLNKIKNDNFCDLYEKIKGKVERNKAHALRIYNEGFHIPDIIKNIIDENKEILLKNNMTQDSTMDTVQKFWTISHDKTYIEDYKIGIIGLGKLGFEVAETFADSFYVEGYDIEEKNETNFKIVNTLEEVVFNKDIIFISVPTPHHPDYDGSQPTSHLEPKDFDYKVVKDVLIKLNDLIQHQTLVVLISTVLPGTIRREFTDLINNFNFNFVYNPYLIAMGTVKQDVLNPEMIIIGTADGSVNVLQQKLYKFYTKLISDKQPNNKIRYELGTYEEAESMKIFYNTFISAKLSIVNMIQDVSDKLGNMNVDIVTNALEKSTKRIISNSYMKAGMGDGGPCHPRDNIALRYLAKSLDLGYDLFDSIMKSREEQAKNIAKKISELKTKYPLPIVIMGESYKPETNLTDGSYSKLISYYLKQIYNYDFKFDDINEKSIFLLCHRYNFNSTVFPSGSVILDPWREFPYSPNYEVVYYGKK